MIEIIEIKEVKESRQNESKLNLSKNISSFSNSLLKKSSFSKKDNQKFSFFNCMSNEKKNSEKSIKNIFHFDLKKCSSNENNLQTPEKKSKIRDFSKNLNILTKLKGDNEKEIQTSEYDFSKKNSFSPAEMINSPTRRSNYYSDFKVLSENKTRKNIKAIKLSFMDSIYGKDKIEVKKNIKLENIWPLILKILISLLSFYFIIFIILLLIHWFLVTLSIKNYSNIIKKLENNNFCLSLEIQLNLLNFEVNYIKKFMFSFKRLKH